MLLAIAIFLLTPVVLPILAAIYDSVQMRRMLAEIKGDGHVLNSEHGVQGTRL